MVSRTSRARWVAAGRELATMRNACRRRLDVGRACDSQSSSCIWRSHAMKTAAATSRRRSTSCVIVRSGETGVPDLRQVSEGGRLLVVVAAGEPDDRAAVLLCDGREADHRRRCRGSAGPAPRHPVLPGCSRSACHRLPCRTSTAWCRRRRARSQDSGVRAFRPSTRQRPSASAAARSSPSRRCTVTRVMFEMPVPGSP